LPKNFLLLAKNFLRFIKKLAIFYGL